MVGALCTLTKRARRSFMSTAAPWSVDLAAGVFGLAVGSFVNVVVYRAPRGLSVVRPSRSFCPTCGTTLRSADNIPVVSWLLLRGRCRSCGHPISARYPMVELTVAAACVAVAMAAGPHWAVIGLCVLVSTQMADLAIELDGMRSLAAPAWWGSAVGALFLVLAGVADRQWSRIVDAAVAGAVVATMAVLVSRGQSRASARLWLVLPGALCWGWAGAEAVLVATVVVIVSLLVLPGVRGASRRVALPRRAGWATAVALSSVAALTTAGALGIPLGR
ncbi:MAG: prepilin peptidase [Acidimicrobiales bacterium]